MSPQTSDKIKPLFRGFIAASILAIGSLLTPSASASTPAQNWMENTGFNDINFFLCVLDEFQTVNDISAPSDIYGLDDALPDELLANITTLSCVDADVTDTTGIDKLPNLESLDLSNNDITELDISKNIKLKRLNIEETSIWDLDVENNADLEELGIDHDIILVTSAYVERIPEGDEFDIDDNKFKMDISGLKFLDPIGEDIVRYNDTASYISPFKTILMREFANSSFLISFRNTGSDHFVHLSARSTYAEYFLVFKDEDKDEITQRAIVEENCSENEYGWISCSDDNIFYGDAIDTDKIIEDKFSGIFKLENYKLSKVDIKPVENFTLTVDSDAVKKGIATPKGDYSYFAFYFEPDVPEVPSTDAPATPDTGLFTNEDGSLKVANILLSLAIIASGASVVLMITRRIAKRIKVKRF